MDKPLIAMAHVPALPGTPLYAESEGVRGLVDHVRQEVSVLVDAGFDAVMFCNENDRPYVLKADLVASAVMARVVPNARPKAFLSVWTTSGTPSARLLQPLPRRLGS